MSIPILLIDEKDEESTLQKRYEILKEFLYSFNCQDTIEFIGDLELIYDIDDESKAVRYQSNPIFHGRKLVFIHAAKDDSTNKFSSDMVENLRSLSPDTIFAEFSGASKINLDIRDLRFRRKENIYGEAGYRLLLFTLYFKKYLEFEFELLTNGGKAFHTRKKNAQEKIDKIKNSILTNDDWLHKKGDHSFIEILKLAGLSQERIVSGLAYIEKIESREEYIKLLGRYYNVIEDACNKSQNQLNNLVNEYLNN